MRTFLARLTGVLVISFALVSAAMADTSATQALAEKLKQYRSYQADFIQIVVDGTGNKVQESRGELKAKRPGLFYWKAETPFAQTIVADGEKVEVYDPDLEQVTIKPMDEQMTSTPALLLSGQVDHLEEAYSVSRPEGASMGEEFILEPKNPDSLFLSLRLRFRDGVLSEMRLRDSLDQVSILSFQDVKVNEPVSNEVFEMDYPDSVDVITSAQ
ncbi:outer membrane lipoprotein carrier protein LolA [Marinobacter nanhaiticus D15-8W]|uniref:Outer-membrane lipoprotein carrier protein n=1 Tax=Marinobacter nanhaiticus D15-8W TaxID=626887 RepID=N6VVL9_9GAMM|nr:outer membrane lipoprotein chaperone LolA [Marinobacter nanhaiticus]ENO14210.1 outer membrane lipoprotein carrier protein LolA [Marinobacter nanhaiticus D15-8W]